MAIKKTTSKQKIGPLGNPLGNPLGFFNSLKGKTKIEPKQTLRKAQNGESIYSGPFTKERTKSLDEKFPSTVISAPYNPWYNTKSYKDRGSNIGENPVEAEKNDRIDYENFIRQNPKLKKGGTVKSKKK